MRDSGVDAERVTLSAILRSRSDESDGEFEKPLKIQDGAQRRSGGFTPRNENLRYLPLETHHFHFGSCFTQCNTGGKSCQVRKRQLYYPLRGHAQFFYGRVEADHCAVCTAISMKVAWCWILEDCTVLDFLTYTRRDDLLPNIEPR